MDWNQIRQKWQAREVDADSLSTPRPVGSAEAPGLAALHQRDSRLRRQIRGRDLLETSVAALVAPAFAVIGGFLWQREQWTALAFCVFLTVWAAYVPVHLWRTRRALPKADPAVSLLDYLRQERMALLAQARMLESIWIWYFAPCAFGVIGLYLSITGATRGALIYALVVIAFCAVMARVNHYAARTRFRALAAQIERQISDLTEE